MTTPNPIDRARKEYDNYLKRIHGVDTEALYKLRKRIDHARMLYRQETGRWPEQRQS